MSEFCSVPTCPSKADPRWYVPMPACDGHGVAFPEEIVKLRAEVDRLRAAIVEWATRRTLMDRWEHHDYNMPYDTAVRLEAAESALLRIAGEGK